MSAACASSPSFHVNGEQCVCLCGLPCVIESVCACCTCVCVCVCVWACVCSTVSFEFPGEQINWQPFAIIDFYHTHKHTLTHTHNTHASRRHSKHSHLSLSLCLSQTQTHTHAARWQQSCWEEGGMMKRIQNSIDCVLVLSRRHKVYCTVRGHKTLTLHQKKKKKQKKQPEVNLQTNTHSHTHALTHTHTDVSAITLHQNTLSRIQK